MIREKLQGLLNWLELNKYNNEKDHLKACQELYKIVDDKSWLAIDLKQLMAHKCGQIICANRIIKEIKEILEETDVGNNG